VNPLLTVASLLDCRKRWGTTEAASKTTGVVSTRLKPPRPQATGNLGVRNKNGGKSSSSNRHLDKTYRPAFPVIQSAWHKHENKACYRRLRPKYLPIVRSENSSLRGARITSIRLIMRIATYAAEILTAKPKGVNMFSWLISTFP
jgi:hypothetical protein